MKYAFSSTLHKTDTIYVCPCEQVCVLRRSTFAENQQQSSSSENWCTLLERRWRWGSVCCCTIESAVFSWSPATSWPLLPSCGRSTHTSAWLPSLSWTNLWIRWTTWDQETALSVSARMTSTPSAGRLKPEDSRVLWSTAAYRLVSTRTHRGSARSLCNSIIMETKLSYCVIYQAPSSHRPKSLMTLTTPAR